VTVRTSMQRQRAAKTIAKPTNNNSSREKPRHRHPSPTAEHSLRRITENDEGAGGVHHCLNFLLSLHKKVRNKLCAFSVAMFF